MPSSCAWVSYASLWWNTTRMIKPLPPSFQGKQITASKILFTGICIVVATFILLSDSKLYTAFANLFYVFGIGLMLLTFVVGKTINGSKSWIPLGGGFNLQPAELCKIFAALALAKFLSRQDLDFSKLSAQIIAAVIAMLPAVISVAQNETGLAIVYASFFIVMYREGLPGWILIVGGAFGALVVMTLILPSFYSVHYSYGHCFNSRLYLPL